MATKKMYDEELQVRLAMAGYHFDALVLRIICLQHQAWDSPHLPTMARTARMENILLADPQGHIAHTARPCVNVGQVGHQEFQVHGLYHGVVVRVHGQSRGA